jgi:hypothetical protein
LYPDPILSQVLVASTYPLEIVEAGRWLAQNQNLKGQQLANAAKQKNWDASVQALVLLPDVLKRLNQDLTWTSGLGNAFLAQQDGVMDAIQRMRQRASAKGALQSTPQQTVSTQTENNQSNIVIEPANPDVVYVPQYNPAAVWGPAPEYYPYPSLYYPSAAGVIAASALSFGAGVAVGAIWGGGWNNWGWNFGWGSRSVVINNNFIRNNHFNRVNVGNGNRWVHNPAHRGGVPYGNRAVTNRFQGGGTQGGRGNLTTRPTVGQVQQRLKQTTPGRVGAGNQFGQGNLGGRGAASRAGQGHMGMRPGGAMPATGGANRIAPGNINRGNFGGNRVGNRNIGGGGGAGAFGGMHRGGGAARMSGSRGFSSMGGGGFRGGGRGGGGFRGGGRRR